MERPPCEDCGERADIVVMPGSNRGVSVQYLCVECFRGVRASGFRAFPISCIDSSETIALDDLFQHRVSTLIEGLQNLQHETEAAMEAALAQYEAIFAALAEQIQALKRGIMRQVGDAKVLEGEKLKSTIFDLRAARESLTITIASADIALMINSREGPRWPPFVDQYTANLRHIQEIIDGMSRSFEGQARPPSISRERRDGDALIMPLDTLNILMTDLSSVERKMIHCEGFQFRSQAKWCLIEKDCFVYTGGLYKSLPINWTDFITLKDLASPNPQVSVTQGTPMCIQRYRHAVVAVNQSVFAMGGMWMSSGEDAGRVGLEVLQKRESWEGSQWIGIGSFPPLLDPTAVVFRGMIYVTGKSRGIFRINPASLVWENVLIHHVVDLATKAPADAEVNRPFDERNPLPRKASNSLICAWETQLVILQHDHMFSFSPIGEEIGMSKKKLSSTRSWYCPFPAIVRGSKAYFMLEPSDPDSVQTGDVWCYDFVLSDVALVKFD